MDEDTNVVELGDTVDLRQLSEEELVRFTYELDDLSPLEFELALRLEMFIDLIGATHPAGMH
jgi:hypothetical protein